MRQRYDIADLWRECLFKIGSDPRKCLHWNAACTTSCRATIACCAKRQSVEVGPQPALGCILFHTTPGRVIFKLVLSDARDTEILAFGMTEVEPADG